MDECEYCFDSNPNKHGLDIIKHFRFQLDYICPKHLYEFIKELQKYFDNTHASWLRKYLKEATD